MVVPRRTVDAGSRIQYAALYVLSVIKDMGSDATALLAKHEELLEPILAWLVEQQYVEIDAKDVLQITGKGSDTVTQYHQRYESFLHDYDVFSAVDLQAGEFAFAYYDDFPGADDWDDFLSEERWDDLRVAVAEHEGVDPVEVIFMSFVHEGRFGSNHEGMLTYDLLLGAVWDEIVDIYNRAIKVADLRYREGDTWVDGETVITDILDQGRDLVRRMKT